MNLNSMLNSPMMAMVKPKIKQMGVCCIIIDVSDDKWNGRMYKSAKYMINDDILSKIKELDEPLYNRIKALNTQEEIHGQ